MAGQDNITNPIDITADKKQKLAFLQRQVKDASTVLAGATAKYEAFVTKANTFALLYQEAEVDLEQARRYWERFQQVKSDLNTLDQTVTEADRVAVNVSYELKELILNWEAVTRDTLQATEAILLASDYILKRKESNPLIAEELVTAATSAAETAEKTVKQVIQALGNTLATLRPATQAKNTAELTNEYIGQAIVELLNRPENVDDLAQVMISAQNQLQLEGPIITNLAQQAANRQTLEASLSDTLQSAKKHAGTAIIASEKAQREMNKAKGELSRAEATLAAWEAALQAAETAITG